MGFLNKICSKCNKNLSLENFYKRKDLSSGTQSWCKECQHKRTKEYKQKVGYRKYNLKAAYNITQEEYISLLNKQNGKCKICGNSKKLLIDHNHSTGQIRGLLCHNCNIALGHIFDNPVIASRLTQYLNGEL